ncbi:Cytochrome P450 89A2 [Zea mays]|uniref:Cytochrome P450 89A2 n=1 Tax=Zea mays TaxID=4577 RepID=A0A3L6F3X9_MAIZE|nr:Cytochrome P450 89A2 [Zea mays]
MQVLLQLLPLVLSAAAILIAWRATPPAVKARLAALQSGIARARKPIMLVTDFATAHHLLVRGSSAGSFSNRPPSMAPSAVLSGRRYHNINSVPYSQLWRALRSNLTSGVLHPTRLRHYAAARRRALHRLAADLREQQLADDGVEALAAESIRSAVFGLVSTMCFGDSGVDAAVVRAMADVQTELVLSLSAVRTFAFVPFLAVSKLVYRGRWNKLAAIRRKQEELYLPLIDGCRRRRGRDDDDSDGTPPSYVRTLLDLRVPVELDGDHGSSGGEQTQQRRLEDGELVGLCSEFLGSGTESVSAALQWIMANLIKRPDMQDAVRREIDDAVDADAEEVGEEVLGKLDLLNAVILETLRLHPTIKFGFREVMQEDQVVHDGHRIPVGTKMVFPLEALGRDKTAWDEPDEFMPERFHGCCAGGESTKKLLSVAAEMKMLPFGGGRRMCPAIGVSLLHIGYFMANLVREFEWREAEGGEHAGVQLHPDATVEMFNFMERPLRARLVPLRRPGGKKFR